MTPAVNIGERAIGIGHPVYVVAELSANHGQKFNEAVRLVEAAKEAGADAIKIQTYTPDTMTIDSPKSWFRITGGTLWDGYTLYDLYRDAYTPWEWYPRLKEIADRAGLGFFSTPFDASAVDYLEKFDAPVYKIASFEIVDIPLIRRAARTKKPLIISTGMASRDEIAEAVGAAQDAGAAGVILLKCTSAYPAPPEEMNLRAIPAMQDSFGVPTGLSDHTLGIVAPVTAVALGACLIEKHFTLSRSVAGPDSGFSLEPAEFRDMVDSIRAAEKCSGSAQYDPGARETASLRFRRSLFVVEDMKAGDVFTPSNVRAIRPSDGLHPRYYDLVLGAHATRDIERGSPLAADMVDRDLGPNARGVSMNSKFCGD